MVDPVSLGQTGNGIFICSMDDTLEKLEYAIPQYLLISLLDYFQLRAGQVTSYIGGLG
jgi:hypothetical protein